MPGNSFGQLFKITTFGESHGGAVGVIIDGCPPGLKISEKDIQPELDRRRPGQSRITTPRAETDEIRIFSGVFEGKTTGTPIMMMAFNKDFRPEDYAHLKNVFRPSHADFTYMAKYGRRDFAGSGRASARETLARVAAGAVAKKFLKEKLGVECLSYVEQVGDLRTEIDFQKVKMAQVEANIIRCPDAKMAEKMITLVEKVRAEGDSIGGVIRGVIQGVPAGLGEPVFDKLAADLGKAMLSINATKGFEFGSGFEGVTMRGSQHNDSFYMAAERAAERLAGKESGARGRSYLSERGPDVLAGKSVRTRTNYSGGTQGGISNGEDIHFRVAFKPVATIMKKQKTVSVDGRHVTMQAAGRHDPCVLPRAVPMVDAMAALVIMDHYLRHKAQCG